MAAHHPPSFTVYTPDQVRNAPFRKSLPAYEELQDDAGVGARTLLKWTGIGIVAGLAVLAALILVLNLSGDRLASSVNARSALVGKVAEPPAKAKVEAPTPPAKVEAAPAPKPELELAPAKKAPPAKIAVVAKKPAKTR